MSEEKKDPPEFEPLIQWLTTDWAHIGLVVSLVVIVILIIAWARK